MRFEIGGIDHDGLLLTLLCDQTRHHAGEDPIVAPPLPSIVKRLVGTVLLGGISPTQAVAIDEDNTAQDTAIIHPWFARGLRKEGLKARHLRLAQQKQIRHVTARFRTVNYAANLKSMGPEPNGLNDDFMVAPDAAVRMYNPNAFRIVE